MRVEKECEYRKSASRERGGRIGVRVKKERVEREIVEECEYRKRE